MNTKQPTQHTPTPCKCFIDHGVDGNEEKIVKCSLCIRAVNSHEALLDALKQAFELIKEGGFSHPMTEEFYDKTMRQANEAIAQAEGE